jgi:hypothetical protein
MCCICLIEDNKKYIKLKCSHELHKKCLTKLIQHSNKCPICRQDIFEDIICECFFFTPYVNLNKCRYCFGIEKKEFIKKYQNILN